MGVFVRLAYVIIELQQVVPFMLPNEWVAWKQYEKQFSSCCDSCHTDDAPYTVTYQDPFVPVTIVYPFVVRLCVDCIVDAQESVGVLDKTDMSEDDNGFKVERQ